MTRFTRNLDPSIVDLTGRRMQAAQAKWDRLTTSDLLQIRTESDLIAAVQQRYTLPYEQAKNDVEIWTCPKPF